MNHLLLDLDKVPTKPQDIPFEHARIALFARPKAAKRLTCPEEPHGIYVLPKKNAAHSIVQAAHEILAHNPETRLVIVSPRKKLLDLFSNLQTSYPRAHLLLSKKLGKKTRHFVRQPATALVTGRPSEEADNDELLAQLHAESKISPVPQNTEDNPALQKIAEEIQMVVERYTSPSPIFTLLSDAPAPEKYDVRHILTWLKKNRPKKQNDLLRLLTQHAHGNINQAAQWLDDLQKQRYISIDAAQNVRYMK